MRSVLFYLMVQTRAERWGTLENQFDPPLPHGSKTDMLVNAGGRCVLPELFRQARNVFLLCANLSSHLLLTTAA